MGEGLSGAGNVAWEVFIGVVDSSILDGTKESN
jgi:hypothetical protein